MSRTSTAREFPAGRQIPVRLVAGAFILNSGISKHGADQETAAQLHGLAAGTYPAVGRMDPQQFVRLLSTSEISLGAALLTPLVPSVVAGVAPNRVCRWPRTSGCSASGPPSSPTT